MQRYSNSRPYLYHLTDPSNLDHIRQTESIFSAGILMERAGRADLMRLRRRYHERIIVENTLIVLRDQTPLHQGNLTLPRGYTFEDFVESLNSRIFFWPGTAAGPIPYGIRHFERYEQEGPVILRVEFQSLLHTNPGAEPLYCRYNSGSPRCSNGKKSPRAPSTFLSGDEFNGTPSQVVEVTFVGQIVLPADTEVGGNPAGPWQVLREAASYHIGPDNDVAAFHPALTFLPQESSAHKNPAQSKRVNFLGLLPNDNLVYPT